MREIRDVLRCSRCQTVLTCQVHDKDIDDEGEWRGMIHWLPRREHSDQDCCTQVALNREQWPTLW
jgi:hypothetical protein